MPSIRVSRQIVGREEPYRLVVARRVPCGRLTITADAVDDIFPVSIAASCTCGYSHEAWGTDPLTVETSLIDLVRPGLDTAHTIDYD